LKSYDLVDVRDEKGERQDAIIEAEFAEGPGQGPHKGKAVSIGNVTSDVEGGCKSGCEQAHNKKAAEIYFVQILRVEKEVGDPQVFAEAACDHRKQNDPAQQQDLVASEVVKQQLDRKRVNEGFPEFYELRHKQNPLKIRFFKRTYYK